jgi:hypothetical protein
VAYAAAGDDPAGGVTPLMAAAGHCDLQTVRSLLTPSADLSAVDAQGRDALSHASLNVNNGFSYAKVRTLKCPDVVVALRQAGADPWRAKFYQSPRLIDKRPQMIALLSVEDDRENKGDSANVTQNLTHAVEDTLKAKVTWVKGGHIALRYPIMKLDEVRQKLRTAGFSDIETIHPDRGRSCTVLGADSVFEVHLKDFRTKDVGVLSATGAGLDFALTDCSTGELLWASRDEISEARGFLLRALASGWRNLCETALDLPPYRKAKE